MFFHVNIGSLCLIFMENPEINTEHHLKVPSSVVIALMEPGAFGTQPVASFRMAQALLVQ